MGTVEEEGPGRGRGHSRGTGGGKAAWLTPPHPVSGDWLFSEPETLNPDPQLGPGSSGPPAGTPTPTPAGWLCSRAPALGCGYDAVCGGVCRGIQLPTAPVRSDSMESQPPSSHGRVSDRAVPAAESAVPSPPSPPLSGPTPAHPSDQAQGALPAQASLTLRREACLPLLEPSAHEPPAGAGSLGSAY